jgi:hypothetical protein
MHAVKAYGGIEVQIHSFLTLAPNGGGASGLSRFTPGKEPAVTMNSKLFGPQNRSRLSGEEK